MFPFLLMIKTLKRHRRLSIRSFFAHKLPNIRCGCLCTEQSIKQLSRVFGDFAIVFQKLLRGGLSLIKITDAFGEFVQFGSLFRQRIQRPVMNNTQAIFDAPKEFIISVEAFSVGSRYDANLAQPRDCIKRIL